MFTITRCWTVIAQDPSFCEWAVYASRVRDEKGEIVAYVPARERCAEFDRPEGTWFTRVVGKRRDCSEEPWELAEVVQHDVHGGDMATPNPTVVGAGVLDPQLVGRVTYDAPEPDEHPHVVQVIQGSDEWLGKLLHEETVHARGPLFPDAARQKTVEFPMDGEGGSTTVVVRTLGFGGRPGSTAVTRTVARPTIEGFHRIAVASISGTTRVNFPAAGATDAWEYDGTDGLRSKAFPAYENLSSDYGVYVNPGTGSFFEALAGANYPTTIKVESDEVDLGASVTFRLLITDTLARDSATQATFYWEDLTYFPAFPADEPVEGLEAESPAWMLREILMVDSKPRQPLRRWRYEYVIGGSSSVSHADGDYVPYVPGQFLTGRYMRVRLVAEELTGQYQVICPTMTIVALLPNRVVVGTGSPEGTTTAGPGSIYVRTNGPPSLYVKASGLGTTGWHAANESYFHREVADQTVGNTTTETSVVNAGAGLSIPAGTLSTNRVVELVIEGTYLNNTGVNRNLTLRVYYGSTEMIDFTVSNIATSASTRAFGIRVRLIGKGATNAQVATMELLQSTAGSPSTGVGGFGPGASGRLKGTATEDSTGALDIDVTVEHSTNDANLTLTVNTVFAEIQ